MMLSSPLQIIASTPPATRAFTATLLLLSLANIYITVTTSASHVPYLTLTLGTWYYYPWTLLTAGFVEPGFLEVRSAHPKEDETWH